MKFKYIIFIIIFLCVSIALTACGNRAWISDAFQNEFNYVVIQEADGIWRVHKIKKWADSESESFCVLTECCGNYIWGSANNAYVYKNFPSYLEEIQQCG